MEAKDQVKIIVQKGNEYLVADRRDLYGGYSPKYSTSPYDAKKYKYEADAKAKAKKIGGRVRYFDSLHGNVW